MCQIFTEFNRPILDKEGIFQLFMDFLCTPRVRKSGPTRYADKSSEINIKTNCST